MPDGRPDIVTFVPVPFVVAPPGMSIRVHVPVAGKPVRRTPPVEILHVGEVIVPIPGAAGVGFTVNEIFEEVAGFPVGQTALDVRVQFTTSPCTGV